uniref:Band 7 domain-containing protein n=1 Tax=Panagrolaimus sp. ES5 TaxID=591445 RepID=A0AC34GX47_9BILA
MVFFCWRSANEQVHSAEEVARKRMFDSAFTYNTEYNYSNSYTNWAQQTNRYSRPQINTEKRLTDLRPQSLIEILFVGLSFILLICTLPFSLIFSLKFVSTFERLVVLRLGKAQEVRGPGTCLVLPFIDKSAKIDISVISHELPSISVITIDKGIVEFSAAIFCKVVDPLISYCNVQNKDMVIKECAYTTTYKYLARRSLHDITNPPVLSKILSTVQDDLNEFVREMGVEIVEVSVTKINVLKQAENQAVNVFNTLMKSDVGTQVIQSLQSHIMQNVSSNNAGNIPKIPLYPPQPPPQQQFPQPKTSPVIIPNDPEVEELIAKIKQCCNSTLVAKVQKRYRIICNDSSENSPADFIIDLKSGDGWATWTTLANDLVNDVDVIFSLSKQTLKALIDGHLSPFTAYMNGEVRISGTVADATGLKYLMDRAKELRCI